MLAYHICSWLPAHSGPGPEVWPFVECGPQFNGHKRPDIVSPIAPISRALAKTSAELRVFWLLRFTWRSQVVAENARGVGYWVGSALMAHAMPLYLFYWPLRSAISPKTKAPIYGKASPLFRPSRNASFLKTRHFARVLSLTSLLLWRPFPRTTCCNSQRSDV